MQSLSFYRSTFWVGCRRLGLLICLLLLLTSCSLPQVKAEDRLFLDVSLDFLGSYQLPKQDFQDTRVGGLSGLTYDRQRDRFYAISDDRSNEAPARFYTLKLTLSPTVESGDNPIASTPTADTSTADTPITGTVEIEKVTLLKGETGEPYAPDTLDLEGIALSPRQSLFISSEGVAAQGIAPFIDEFDLATGEWRSRLPIAKRYLPRTEDGKSLGVQDNQGFEALTLSATSYGDTQEPFRLFTATESALQQDLSPEATAPPPIRFLHYLVGNEQTLLLSEHPYPIEPLPEGAVNLGLTELLVLDQGGHFLSLERSFGLTGFDGKIFQLATGGATDIASISHLDGGTEGITPIHKRLVLDLTDLGRPLDNFEGMALGPQLPDGSQSLILVSDDNFNPLQTTEFLIFRLRSQ